jgi:hypothetical protein
MWGLLRVAGDECIRPGGNQGCQDGRVVLVGRDRGDCASQIRNLDPEQELLEIRLDARSVPTQELANLRIAQYPCDLVELKARHCQVQRPQVPGDDDPSGDATGVGEPGDQDIGVQDDLHDG